MAVRVPLSVCLVGLFAAGSCAAADDGSEAAGGDGAGTSSADAATSDADGDGVGDETGVGEDLDMSAEDFACLQGWTRVRAFRIVNLLGHQDETLAVANSPTGGSYPVGTVIQLIPTEAMVKRAQGWSPGTNDWEFFALEVDAAGTTIVDRGADDVVNAFGGNCFECHAKAEPQWDLICEDDHGCDPLPIGDDIIDMLQANDPRCG